MKIEHILLIGLGAVLLLQRSPRTVSRQPPPSSTGDSSSSWVDIVSGLLDHALDAWSGSGGDPAPEPVTTKGEKG